MDDSDGSDEISEPAVAVPPAKEFLPNPTETPGSPPAPPSNHISPPIPAPSACPSCSRHVPMHLDPTDFSAYGCCKETVTNAYEDLWNGNTSVNIAIPEDDIMSGFICDDAHLANKVIKQDTPLPDNPSLQDALAGPEHDSWHAVILDELAAIRDTGTWTLVDHTPNICNIVGC